MTGKEPDLVAALFYIKRISARADLVSRYEDVLRKVFKLNERNDSEQSRDKIDRIIRRALSVPVTLDNIRVCSKSTS